MAIFNLYNKLFLVFRENMDILSHTTRTGGVLVPARTTVGGVGDTAPPIRAYSLAYRRASSDSRSGVVCTNEKTTVL